MEYFIVICETPHRKQYRRDQCTMTKTDHCGKSNNKELATSWPHLIVEIDQVHGILVRIGSKIHP